MSSTKATNLSKISSTSASKRALRCCGSDAIVAPSIASRVRIDGLIARSERSRAHRCRAEAASCARNLQGAVPSTTSRTTSLDAAALHCRPSMSSTTIRVSCHAHRRARTSRRHDDRARRGGDAGLHAGRDAGRGEGRDASRSRRARRRDTPQQHLSSVSASRRRPDRAPRRPAPFHRLDEADPDRQRRLSGVQPRGAAHDRRGGRALQSHLDGSPHLLTPEKAADIQAQLGSDIAMVLDECLAYPADDGEARTRWSGRSAGRGAPASACLALRAAPPTACRRPMPARRSSGSCRVACFRICARRAPARTVAIGFEGYAIGGLSVGEPIEVMYGIVGWTTPLAAARIGRAI